MDSSDAGPKKKPAESFAKNKGKSQSRRRSCGTTDEDPPGSSKTLAKKRCVFDLSQMHAKSHDGKSVRCLCVHSGGFCTALGQGRGSLN